MKNVLLLGLLNFKNNGNLDLDNNRVKFRYINKDKLKKWIYKPFDLLIENLVEYWSTSWQSCINNKRNFTEKYFCF